MWQQELGTIVINKQVMTDHYKMVITAPKIAKKSEAGQFLHVQVSKNLDPLLRRPISIFHVDENRGTVTILYRVAGRGTALLAEKSTGELLDILGPLGKGFQLPAVSSDVLIVGGGIGLAPLNLLIDKLITANNQVKLIAGLRNSEYLPLTKEFTQQKLNIIITTDDGSYGEKGFVTNIFERELASNKYKMIYACGPEPMLAKVAQLANELEIPCQVSLEKTMACGVGACLGCTCTTVNKEGQLNYSHVCKDGPVFWGREVMF